MAGASLPAVSVSGQKRTWMQRFDQQRQESPRALSVRIKKQPPVGWFREQSLESQPGVTKEHGWDELLIVGFNG